MIKDIDYRNTTTFRKIDVTNESPFKKVSLKDVTHILNINIS